MKRITGMNRITGIYLVKIRGIIPHRTLQKLYFNDKVIPKK